MIGHRPYSFIILLLFVCGKGNCSLNANYCKKKTDADQNGSASAC